MGQGTISSQTEAQVNEVLRRWMDRQLYPENLEYLVDLDTAISLKQLMTRHMSNEAEEEGGLYLEPYERFAKSILPLLGKGTRQRLEAAGLWLYVTTWRDPAAVKDLRG